MHGKYPVNHDHGCSRDGKFVRQALDLLVQLMKREPPTQVQPRKTGFHIRTKCFQAGDEAGWVYPTSSVHPMHHFSLSQCMDHPIFCNTTNAFACTPGATELVELSTYGLQGAWVNAPASLKKPSVDIRGWSLVLHTNH